MYKIFIVCLIPILLSGCLRNQPQQNSSNDIYTQNIDSVIEIPEQNNAQQNKDIDIQFDILSDLTIPRGLESRPMEQLISYFDKPVPQGFRHHVENTYADYGEFIDEIIMQIYIHTKDGMVNRVSYSWRGDDYESIVNIREQLETLFGQYNMGIPFEKNSTWVRWMYNDYKFSIIEIKQIKISYEVGIQLIK